MCKIQPNPQIAFSALWICLYLVYISYTCRCVVFPLRGVKVGYSSRQSIRCVRLHKCIFESPPQISTYSIFPNRVVLLLFRSGYRRLYSQRILVYSIRFYIAPSTCGLWVWIPYTWYLVWYYVHIRVVYMIYLSTRVSSSVREDLAGLTYQ